MSRRRCARPSGSALDARPARKNAPLHPVRWESPMAGETDFQGTDTDPRAKDGAKNGPVKKKAPDPGKTTNVDPAGVSPAIPGKRTNTDGMDADGGQQGTPGKSTQVDAKEGKDGNDAIAKQGPGGGAPKTDADHNGAAVDGGPIKVQGGPGKGPVGDTGKQGTDPAAKNKTAPKGDTPPPGGKDKDGGPLHLAKPAAPAQKVDPGTPATLPTFSMTA